MAWVNSREFAKNHNINVEGVLKAIKRADSKNKNFCRVKCHYIHFFYSQGRGGNSGKVLKIWDEPFSSEEEVMAFYEKEVLGGLLGGDRALLGASVGTKEGGALWMGA